MIQIFIIILLLQQYIHTTQGQTCASNPCGLIVGLYDGNTGYCCYDVLANNINYICACPNNIQTANTACRTIMTNQGTCTKTCVNGGVCNIVNGQQVCWCQLGYSGENCELQGIQNRCYNGLCQYGTCFEQTTGISTYSYCQCTPGYLGITCNQCYFSCPGQGVFADTAQCGIGRYFYCQQAYSVPISALCSSGQKFNRFTNQCDTTYQCT